MLSESRRTVLTPTLDQVITGAVAGDAFEFSSNAVIVTVSVVRVEVASAVSVTVNET